MIVGMWRTIGVVLGIILVALVEMGLSLWWWCDTSMGDWSCAPVKYVMGMLWGMAPPLVWVMTAFLVMLILHRRDGSSRWE